MQIEAICKELGWRHGQFLFNFLEWLRLQRGYQAQLDMTAWAQGREGYVGRMADPFHIPNETLAILLNEYITELRNARGRTD